LNEKGQVLGSFRIKAKLLYLFPLVNCAAGKLNFQTSSVDLKKAGKLALHAF
jgi:hypothetical protein